ncbi:PAS domain S-box-containing protein [Desulfacinum hydrothermale DSM 13146]|uniref:histidine kinase n=1 Tax=Desulfacinum hydrothermale DSM 13146 TaxID=1121390 RepID=A0A1W1XVL6_9BACT|nr:PAS domain S-box protein [Desulfacinum hydrothermale]SMC27578.1 PAS domain S-box-containing protein [Desulfacinum hydrothermale DSM 13146]
MFQVLVVDDNPNDRFLIRRLIVKEWPDARIREVGGRADFEEALADFSYTVVITDYHLHWSDGLQVLKEVRRRDRCVPVIMLTGTGTEEVAVQALKSGLSDYLLKKHMKRLPAAIRESLEKSRLTREVARARRELEASEKRYRSMVESASDWIFTLDPEGRYLSVNRKALEVLGLAAEEVVGRRVIDIHGSEEAQTYLDRVRYVVETGQSISFEHEFHWKGQRQWHRDVLYPILGPDGRVEAVGGICVDITETKRMEQQLQESMERYRILAEHSPVGVVITQDMQFVYVNPAAARLLGKTPDEVVGENILSFVREEYRDLLRQAHLDRVAGKTVPIAYRLALAGEGKERWVEVHGSQITHAGRPAALGILVDITDRMEAERRNRLFQATVEQAFEGIVIADGDGVIQYVNPSFLASTGYRSEDLVGRSIAVLQSEHHDPAFYETMWRTVKAGQVWRGLVTTSTSGGETRQFQVTVSPVRDETGRIVSLVSVNRDVTQERALEAQLRQAQKMEALGTLAGGIAHDFNNILGAIVGYTELALMALEGDHPVRKHLDRVLNAGHRARDLVQQILTFSRQKEMEKRPVHLRYIVKEATKLLRASLPSTIEIREYAPSEVPPVLGDPTQLHQVIMNLCTNAFHAMRETGGLLEVRLEAERLDKESLDRFPELKEGDHVVLTVKDTGHGIAPELLDRIFEPYFTTKEVGEGTGLGLAVVHGIVTGLNGAIRVESEPGRGTTFRVHLPALMEEAPERPVEGPQMELPGGSERILLVDDEPALVELAQQILSRLGYRVTAFHDPREALARFRQEPDAFDLILTDMTMPKVTGKRLAHEVRALRPNLPVILTSGYSDSIGSEEARLAGFSAFVKKPYRALEMAQTVREVLDRYLESGPKTRR